MQTVTPDMIDKLHTIEQHLDEIKQLLVQDKKTRREGQELNELRISVSAIARQLSLLDRQLTVLR